MSYSDARLILRYQCLVKVIIAITHDANRDISDLEKELKTTQDSKTKSVIQNK